VQASQKAGVIQLESQREKNDSQPFKFHELVGFPDCSIVVTGTLYHGLAAEQRF
jgi:hypothetical protein